MEDIKVYVNKELTGEIFFEKNENFFGFNYLTNNKPVSLAMPFKNSTYIWKYYLHPIFDMNMPEGYLFEIFKKFLTKEYGYINDFIIFSHICPNIQSRLTFESQTSKSKFENLNLEDILENDNNNTFIKIVNMFLNKNAISGIQPKSLAVLKDKESLTTKEYIIKTFGEEYPELVLNEYFCLKSIEKAGIEIPNIKLSKNNRFLVVEKFNYDKKNDSFFGFEEIACLLGKNKDEKYSGSYEQVAKVLYSVCTNKIETMKNFFKLIVMNYLLKNGDAHLKNFGIIYDTNISEVKFAPAYDVVNTLVYFPKDKPALTMFGKKLWFGRKELIKFGILNCFIKEKQANEIYDSCIYALKDSIKEVEEYCKINTNFEEIGSKLINIWKISLDEKTYKEIKFETL